MKKGDIYFKLLKPIGIYKIGHKFECFGGLVSGVSGITFCIKDESGNYIVNKEYFKMIEYKPRKKKNG